MTLPWSDLFKQIISGGWTLCRDGSRRKVNRYGLGGRLILKKKPATVPYGGSKTVLHTNPLAMGFRLAMHRE